MVEDNYFRNTVILSAFPLILSLYASLAPAEVPSAIKLIVLIWEKSLYTFNDSVQKPSTRHVHHPLILCVGDLYHGDVLLWFLSTLFCDSGFGSH